MNPSAPDPTTRFTGLSELYSKARPSYPCEAIDYVVEKGELAPNTVLADVGCGTGISSRLFAERGCHVIGIEPNEDMRRQAEQQNGEHHVDYRPGTGEATGLFDQIVDMVVAAQAFHWFRADEALREFHRILKPRRWVVLMWNERDERDPFTKAYGDALRTAPETAKVEMHRGKAGEPLLTCPLFINAHRVTFGNSQVLDEEGVMGRAFSASYAPKDELGATRLRQRLTDIFSEFAENGMVELMYETSVYMAQKP